MARTKIYLAMQVVLCVLLVVLLSISAVGVYRDGMARRVDNPRVAIYTREIAAERFAPLAPLTFIAIGMMIAGIALGIRDENADKPVKDSELVRDIAVARVATPSQAMRQAQAAQRRLRIAGWTIFGACAIPVCLYLAKADHFPLDDLEGMFYALIRVALPWAAAGIGALAVTSLMLEKYVVQEIEAAKAQLALERANGASAPANRSRAKGNPVALQAVILIAAVVFIVLGVFNQSARDVLYKAITICTECVGLG